VKKLTPEERERFQRILEELRSSQAVADVLRRQIALLTASLSELSLTSETIRTTKQLKPETEILVPIGSDSFITAKLALADKVITGLGADVAAERGVDDALKVLEARGAEVGKSIERLRQELEKLGERMEELRPEVERILAKIKAERK
jgi:prefoldin alpha subunit